MVARNTRESIEEVTKILKISDSEHHENKDLDEKVDQVENLWRCGSSDYKEIIQTNKMHMDYWPSRKSFSKI